MIIDMHSHLGDILYPGGGRLFFEKGIRKKAGLDLIGIAEKGLYKTNRVSQWFLENFLSGMVTKAARARNAAGTLENMRQSMDVTGVSKTACKGDQSLEKLIYRENALRLLGLTC